MNELVYDSEFHLLAFSIDNVCYLIIMLLLALVCGFIFGFKLCLLD